MKTSIFRVGIIGAGSIARGQHLPAWRQIPDAEVAVICDINKNAAEMAMSEYGSCQIVLDYHEMMSMGLNAIDICAPNSVHFPAAKAALSAGISVLCEKPLCITAAQVRELGELAESKGLVLMTAQHLRFSDQALATRHFIEGDRLGEVYHAEVKALRRSLLPVTAGFIDGALSGGGPCLDIGVHALDLAMWCMGFPRPVRVTGNTRVNFAKGNAIPGSWGEWDRSLFSVEDFAAGFVHFENGSTLALTSSWLGHHVEAEEMSFRLFGMKAGLHWPSGDYADVVGGAFASGKISSPRSIDRPHLECIKAFYNAVREKSASPIPWQQTEKVIAILAGIYAAAKSGKEVVL